MCTSDFAAVQTSASPRRPGVGGSRALPHATRAGLWMGSRTRRQRFRKGMLWPEQLLHNPCRRYRMLRHLQPLASWLFTASVGGGGGRGAGLKGSGMRRMVIFTTSTLQLGAQGKKLARVAQRVEHAQNSRHAILHYLCLSFYTKLLALIQNFSPPSLPHNQNLQNLLFKQKTPSFFN